jgi:hypothetical protein
MDSDFQCRMQQLHPKIGIILFFVRCQMRQPHPTLKIPFRVNRPLMRWKGTCIGRCANGTTIREGRFCRPETAHAKPDCQRCF